MTKKHTPGFQSTKPQAASHSSLLTSKGPPVNSPGPQSVNDRLRELRRGASNVTPYLLPPRLPLRSGSRHPGPATPPSWIAPGLDKSQHAPRSGTHDGLTRQPPPILPDQPLPQPRSLRATCLNHISRDLEWQMESGAEWFDLFTTRMRIELLAVISQTRPDALDRQRLRQLLRSSSGQGITHVSLGPMLRNPRNYHELAKLLERPGPKRAKLLDSWEDDDDGSGAPSGIETLESISHLHNEFEIPSIETAPSITHRPFTWHLFPSLTHLSLAKAPFASWSHLLQIGDTLVHLTHLDLSYWGTPNIAGHVHETKILAPPTNSTVMQAESLLLFNRLGKACRSLQWLGLEGCEAWVQLIGLSVPRPVPRSSTLRYFDGLNIQPRTPSSVEIDWIGAWRGLQTINLRQALDMPGFCDQSRSRNQATARTMEEKRLWIGHEIWVRQIESLISRTRNEASLQPIRFEKTPVHTWFDIELRESTENMIVEKFVLA